MQKIGQRMKGIHWRASARRFGVWGVRDYYTILEQMAREGAEITFGYILVILAAALLATTGLLLDNASIIIGAMCIAPFLGPSRGVCIGGLYRNGKIFWGGLIKQILGLLVVGSLTAYLITVLLKGTVPGVEITQEILLRAMPNEKDFVLNILTAIGAGMAASLALSADPRIVAKPWGQIIDAMIGVEIAISLLPPACVVGMGYAFGRPEISRNAFWLLLVNVIGLDFIGSTLMLALRGVRRRYLDRERQVRDIVRTTVLNSHPDEIVDLKASVVLLGEAIADVHATIRAQPAGRPTPDLAQDIAHALSEQANCRSCVTLEWIPSLQATTPGAENLADLRSGKLHSG
jgi:uncharacterized hydrophobic protein (TIGR00271 family)